MTVSGSISALYNSILGRPADPDGLANYVAAVAGGATLDQVAMAIAASPESQSNLQAIYESELGRAADQGGLTNFTDELAAGIPLSALRAEVAASPEAQSDLNDLYANILGRSADSGGLAYFTQFLAGGASLADIQGALANSTEITNDVTSAYGTLVGHAPNAVALAAYHSELASGANFSLLQLEIHELVGGTPPRNTSLIVTGKPETIAGAGPNLVYGILNNDALVAQNPQSAILIYGGTSGVAVLPDFNPSTDVLQIQSSQDAGFADLHLTAAGGSTIIQLGGGGEIIFSHTSENALQASNFRFV